MKRSSLRSKLKDVLPPAVVPVLIRGKIAFMTVWWSLRCAVKKTWLLRSLLRARPRLHIGCGEVHVPDCINIDLRPTRATDIVEDCVRLQSIPSGTIQAVFANAFLEHVFLSDRQACLRSIYRVLENDGYMAITAIPDFERIARAYLGKKPGIVLAVFDLLNVYRYTHGEPEGAPDWLAQLHKSLFDAPTLCMLLKQAGFGSFCLFVYAYRTDRIAISFGVIAYKQARAIHWDRKVIRQLLGPLAPDVNSSSLRIITKHNAHLK